MTSIIIILVVAAGIALLITKNKSKFSEIESKINQAAHVVDNVVKQTDEVIEEAKAKASTDVKEVLGEAKKATAKAKKVVETVEAKTKKTTAKKKSTKK
jgi:hypothetical protein